MLALFTTLSGINLLCLLLTAVLGLAGRQSSAALGWHVLAGAMACFVCCIVHCVVFTYFIATSKWISHAIAVKRLDQSLAEPTRSFRAAAFPAALAAMFTILLAAALGAASANYRLMPIWHEAAAALAIAVNMAAAWVEYRAIGRNAALIDAVLAQITAQVIPEASKPCP